MSCLLRNNRVLRMIGSCRIASRLYGSLDIEQFEDVANKTTMTLGSEDSDVDPLFISAVCKGGFIFRATRFHCPITIVRDVMFKWHVQRAEEVTFESLAVFRLVHPKIDMMVIGTGDEAAPVRPHVLEKMRKMGILCEVQDTRNAAGTFNLLRAERGLLVAAALIPTSEDKEMILPKVKRYEIA